jgi:hypothetical protein
MSLIAGDPLLVSLTEDNKSHSSRLGRQMVGVMINVGDNRIDMLAFREAKAPDAGPHEKGRRWSDRCVLQIWPRTRSVYTRNRSMLLAYRWFHIRRLTFVIGHRITSGLQTLLETMVQTKSLKTRSSKQLSVENSGSVRGRRLDYI